jgi:hypothetical protein
MKPYTSKTYPNTAIIKHNTRLLLSLNALGAALSLLEEFLVDQDSLKAPYRNAALCEKTEALLASFDK